MDEFAFTVLIPPGQNPGLVNVGWVVSHIKISKPAFTNGATPFIVDPDFNAAQTVTTAADTTQKGRSTDAVDNKTHHDDTTGSEDEEKEKPEGNPLELAEVRQVAVCLLQSDLTLKVLLMKITALNRITIASHYISSINISIYF